MKRDTLYLIIGIAVFLVSAVVLLISTDLSLAMVIVIAFLISIASDIVIVIDNERRNTAADAKFHHRNELVGESACVLEDFRLINDRYAGTIEIRGERWKAVSQDGELSAGDRVTVIDRTGMTFTVTSRQGASRGD